MAQSRKRKKSRHQAPKSQPPRLKGSDPLSVGNSRGLTPSEAEPAANGEPVARGYARGRAKDEAARAALVPLAPGERPTAVTVGAIVAALLAAANLIAVIAGWEGVAGGNDRVRAVTGSLLAAGLDYVRHAAAHGSGKPWFAIGGIDLDNVREVIAAGASRVVVVRAIRDAGDPRAAAAALRAALQEASVGAEP